MTAGTAGWTRERASSQRLLNMGGDARRTSLRSVTWDDILADFRTWPGVFQGLIPPDSGGLGRGGPRGDRTAERVAHPVRVERRVEVEALGDVAAHAADRVELVLALDALGD